MHLLDYVFLCVLESTKMATDRFIASEYNVMYLLDSAFYMYRRQCEVVWLSLALKLGFHPVAISHLSPGTSSLVVS
jgi:hypothetical protein